MEFINKLEEQIKKSLNVPRAIMPSDEILDRAGLTKTRFRFLLQNRVKMNAWEAIVLAEWLEVDVRDLVSPVTAEVTH